MDEPIEILYFNWLYSRVADVHAHLPQLRFYELFTHLHETEFVWCVQGDDNRAEDGRDLRAEFFRKQFIHNDGSLSNEGCSVFEFLIAFSDKAAFETDEPARDWFWVMLTNLGLGSINDATPYNARAVQDILNRFMFRTYHSNGHGGLFPLNNTNNDQRKLEVWYQFNEYLFEMKYD